MFNEFYFGKEKIFEKKEKISKPFEKRFRSIEVNDDKN